MTDPQCTNSEGCRANEHDLDTCPGAQLPQQGPTPEPPKYPEHEKLMKVADLSQAIGEFMEWLEDQGIFLAHYEEGHSFPRAYATPIVKLLAKHFDIDLERLEDEKRQMLDELASLR